MKITNNLELIAGDKKISVEPSDLEFEVDFQLNYENKIIGKIKNLKILRFKLIFFVSFNIEESNFED